MTAPSFKGVVSVCWAFHKFSLAPSCGPYHNTSNLIVQHYVDGGFSSMQPVLPSPCSQILKVSPFSGEADICPADTPSMWEMVVSGTTLKGNMANGLRIINALYPMTLQVKQLFYSMLNSQCADFAFLKKHWQLLRSEKATYNKLFYNCGPGK